MKLILHNYFRSSTSLRVRIVLALKGLDYEYAAYALLENAHKQDEFIALNPQGLVPALQTQESVIPQSMAIMEYLEEVHPMPSLLPEAPLERARVRSLAQIVAMDIHPVNNLRILQYIRAEFGADDAAVKRWFQRWAHDGFEAMESRLANEKGTGRYCHGNSLSLADVCLVSQAINNQRFAVKLDSYPTIARIVEECLAIPAFQHALPDQQPDAV